LTEDSGYFISFSFLQFLLEFGSNWPENPLIFEKISIPVTRSQRYRYSNFSPGQTAPFMANCRIISKFALFLFNRPVENRPNYRIQNSLSSVHEYCIQK